MYGSLTRQNNVATSGKRIVYCVHGKPSAGCCTVLEGEVIDIGTDDFLSTPHKENSDATNLGILTIKTGLVDINELKSSIDLFLEKIFKTKFNNYKFKAFVYCCLS